MKLASLMLIPVLAAPLAAGAAEKHDDAHPSRGGVSAETPGYHFELVIKEKSLTLYVDGHDSRPVDTRGAKATAAVFSGKEKATVEFTAAGANAMKAEIPFTPGNDAKFVVSFTGPGKKTEQARFAPGAKQDHKGHKH